MEEIKQELSSDETGRIYFVMADYHGAYIKIGVATKTEVDVRLSSLQTGNPTKLMLLGTVEGISKDEVYQAEKLLHEKFSSVRVEGEWFKAHERLMRFIRDETTDPKLSGKRRNRRSKNQREWAIASAEKRKADLHGPLPQFMTRAISEMRYAANGNGLLHCPGCNTDQDEQGFYANKRRSNGRNGHCIGCHNGRRARIKGHLKVHRLP